jgi:hypothetical protein
MAAHEHKTPQKLADKPTHTPGKGDAVDVHHVHGSMEISHQEKTFVGFLRACAWVAGVTIVVLIFLALVNA